MLQLPGVYGTESTAFFQFIPTRETRVKMETVIIYMVLRILVLDYSELSLLLAFFAAGLLMHGGCRRRQAAEPILFHHKFPASHIFDRRQVCSLRM